ncbi:beta-ketoacyl synthase [Deinococcus grandis]|uniref:Beta-ketoacyl synthase n=1 Tax=Deinococcus grandis TaxID=57498 RepID=A0A100HHD9_9DEIO|nr:hypothetical protein DEGR_24630 [Deinococcus grandis]GAQ20785.1 beta-ketoacyl synthase [Deinococcus grandis]
MAAGVFAAQIELREGDLVGLLEAEAVYLHQVVGVAFDHDERFVRVPVAQVFDDAGGEAGTDAGELAYGLVRVGAEPEGTGLLL